MSGRELSDPTTYTSDGKFTDVIANETRSYERALERKFLVFPLCDT